MHKGRPYPYVWRRWATNFCFWPWLVGNQLNVAQGEIWFDDWDWLFIGPTARVSGPGVVSADASRVEFTYTDTVSGNLVVVSLYNGTGPHPQPGQIEIINILASGEFSICHGAAAFEMTNPSGYQLPVVYSTAGFVVNRANVLTLCEYTTWSDGAMEPAHP